LYAREQRKELQHMERTLGIQMEWIREGGEGRPKEHRGEHIQAAGSHPVAERAHERVHDRAHRGDRHAPRHTGPIPGQPLHDRSVRHRAAVIREHTPVESNPRMRMDRLPGEVFQAPMES
jgi:hypothetical protein